MFRVMRISRRADVSVFQFNNVLRRFFSAENFKSKKCLVPFSANKCYCLKCASSLSSPGHLSFKIHKRSLFGSRSYHSLNKNLIPEHEFNKRANDTRFLCTCNGCILNKPFSTRCEARKTCLYDLHIDHHGKLVDFAGWLLPLQYGEAIATSHQHTRMAASLFDVGHMLQTVVSGRHAGEFLESLTPSDLKNLPIGKAALTVFTNDQGGILDDLIITKDGEDKFFVVSNAGRRDEDSELLLKQQKIFTSHDKKVSLEFLDPLEQGLVALQGPKASQALQSFTTINLNDLKFMHSLKTEFFGNQIRISRCGYTGEDGFEISLPRTIARQFVDLILSAEYVKLAGLGVRDSLRLEAGLCLYGIDINETTTPVEADLTWLIAKRRRAEKNFPGAEKILFQILTKPLRKRVGLLLGQGPPARAGAVLLTPEGEAVGKVTSGGPSPTLGRHIAMGYLPLNLCHPGSGVLVEIRGKTYKATVSKMPFVKTNYYTGKESAGI
ncbi:aminomethyltransferase, mitochondrial [Neodiprion lecontei]|uniref:Aminomethyltransferase n=1 Tax=Neodiprion lecontei TaxID=441921 RepID=A0A6J0B5D0_NEOLC|nr:aminomethyltransferase, mitochondrial [Neodiprion lecontei]